MLIGVDLLQFKLIAVDTPKPHYNYLVLTNFDRMKELREMKTEVQGEMRERQRSEWESKMKWEATEKEKRER